MDIVKINFKCDKELRGKVKSKAALLGVTQNVLIVMALNFYLRESNRESVK